MVFSISSTAKSSLRSPVIHSGLHAALPCTMRCSELGEGMFSTRKLLILAVSAFLIIAALETRHVSAQEAASRPSNPAPKAAPAKGAAATGGAVARGKYIVEDVAYGTNCHTPRNSNGTVDRSKWLQGGPLFWQPAHPVQNYPQLAPRIAGTPPASDDEMITLLTTGVWKDGTRLREPMPQFRLTKEDAQAVIAYLKTLTPVQ